MKVKKDFSELNLTDIDLGNTKIFIIQSFCPYYKILWSKSKRLHAMKQIHSYYVSSGTVKEKLEENSRPISITHATDFSQHFPGIDRSPSSQMCQSCCIDPVVFNFYDVRLFACPFWCIYIQKLCFFDILFSGVDRLYT